MRKLLPALLLIAAPVFAGDLVARQGNDSVTLTDKPCTIIDKIAEAVPQGLRGYLRLARAEFQGVQYVACWVPASGVVRLFYDDGDQGLVPLQDLKPAMDL